MSSNTAVLLLAHGSPDRVEDVPCFLHAVTGGRSLPDDVVKEIQHRYSLIGHSPLREITIKQSEGLQRELGMPVYVGMRNWEPYIRDVIPQMVADGIERAVVICLAPHNSRTSVGLYKKALLGESGEAPFEVDFVESWHDQPSLIAAFAEKLRAGWKKACSLADMEVPVIFTAHSVPTRTITEGDPYEAQARETADLVATQMGWRTGPSSTDPDGAQPRFQPGRNERPVEYRLAFQSQGISGGPWLGPTVEETIELFTGQRHAALFIQPIGFLCDHVEILYDIDIYFRKFADERAIDLWRAESLNDSPVLIQALADIARSRLDATVAAKPRD